MSTKQKQSDTNRRNKRKQDNQSPNGYPTRSSLRMQNVLRTDSPHYAATLKIKH